MTQGSIATLTATLNNVSNMKSIFSHRSECITEFMSKTNNYTYIASWERNIFLLPPQNDSSENHHCQTTSVSFAWTYL